MNRRIGQLELNSDGKVIKVHTSKRKPHNLNAGYKCELKAKLGGHIVVYDRCQTGIDGEWRWVVMHEPSSNHVCVSSLSHARHIMKGVARAETIDDAQRHADILPIGNRRIH